MALLMITTTVALTDRALRRLNDEVRRREKPIGNVLRETRKTSRTAIVHIHADGANGRNVGPAALQGSLPG